MNLIDLMTPHAAAPCARIHGVLVGVVTNNQDPDRLGRVKLRLPWLSDGDESAWARVASAMAGPNRGLFLLPEVDDEVLVVFEHGDPRFPYVLGALWNGQAGPPADNADGGNNARMLRSRSGHVIRLDDTDGAERIEIIASDGTTKVVMDAQANTITLSAGAGKIRLEGQSIEIVANGPLKLQGLTVDIN